VTPTWLGHYLSNRHVAVSPQRQREAALRHVETPDGAVVRRRVVRALNHLVAAKHDAVAVEPIKNREVVVPLFGECATGAADE
jgi:hypothetical protein